MRRLFALTLFALAGCARLPPPQPFAAPHAVSDSARLVVVGDLQRTAPLLEFWREQNDSERALVVGAIAAERPDLLAITGDCVFDGGDASLWARFDALMQPVRDAKIPAVAALGNHEYWLGGDGPAHLFERFPHLREHAHYQVAFGPLRLVVLDSNRSTFDADAWRTQVRWLEHTLAALDDDAGVRGVFVLFHHPPYTNSSVTGDEAFVQDDLVPPFARAKKTLAMLNGHVHSYERFEKGGKMYVVSGGGGGPRARLLVGDARRHPDDRFAGPPIRDFHFTVYTLTPDGVRAEVRAVAKGGRAFYVMDRFAMRWPRTAR